MSSDQQRSRASEPEGKRGPRDILEDAQVEAIFANFSGQSMMGRNLSNQEPRHSVRCTVLASVGSFSASVSVQSLPGASGQSTGLEMQV